MKKLVIALTIATTLPFTVQAKEDSVALEFCKPIHHLAETIMERDKRGRPWLRCWKLQTHPT